MRPRFIALVVALASTTIALNATAQAALSVTWMPGVTSPGTPAGLDRVGVIKVGPAHWQVWSVERRENLLEDQSELNLAKRGDATATQMFDPSNAFFSHLIPSLRTVATSPS